MAETPLEDEVGKMSAKRKTTYPRDHPTENPKPAKRTKAEIQRAAMEKREAVQAEKEAKQALKEQKLLDVAKKRQISAQRIANVEDSVQRSQRELQSQSERPDLKTMKTYLAQKQATRQASLEGDGDESEDDEEMQVELPPASTVDTDSSEGGHVEFSDDNDDMYVPSGEEKTIGSSGDDEGDALSDASMEKLYKQLKKEKEKRKKGKLQAEVQAHRQVAPTVYARPDHRMLEQGKEEREKNKRSGKPAAEIGGLQKDWKKRAQVVSQPISSLATAKTAVAEPSGNLSRTGRPRELEQQALADQPVSDGDGLEESESGIQADGGEIGHDEDEELMDAVRKSKQTSHGAKKTHRSGTMGIKLNKADITAVKSRASVRRSAKPRYKNGDLPFENPNRDLQTWRNAVIPAIIDWAGVLDEPFAVNSHPDLHDIIEENWSDEFPEIPADDAVRAVASSAIRNWRSAIGKQALQQLAKIFAAEPFKNSKYQRKEYVDNQLKDLSYIYRDPVAKSGAYRSSAVIEIYAIHQQIITKTDKFYGYPAGAMSLCAAAHERALKLWRTGNAPSKDTKSSFVRRPWATRATSHFKVIAQLSERVWNDIHETASALGSVEDFDPDADDSEMDEPAGMVQLSSSDED
ncbi:hypothetical protein BDZ97DRAFT_820868 [Flammula alnicola]|nr:hypothetical protein BDZ97DRAFT_820868 [Flammula alnicola]